MTRTRGADGRRGGAALYVGRFQPFHSGHLATVLQMPDINPKHLSKFLSLVLRHQPEVAHLTLDASGWVSVDDLLAGCRANGFAVDRVHLDEVVRKSDKQRFAFSDDGTRIRAQQGHSINVELGYEPATPPVLLFHGTVEEFLAPIRMTGLEKGARTHVHLSSDRETARKVGQRRGRPVLIEVEAARMAADGHRFYLTPNRVWLAERVPPQYLRIPN